MSAMKPLLIRIALTTVSAVTLTTASHVALSSDYGRHWEDDDHAYDHARRAVDRGEARPIAELLEQLENQVPGEVVGVEFEREHGRWVYEFKIIDSEGRLLEVYVDAQTGTVLSMEED
jgi:uncharacterized membrane protein YkoI